MKAPDHITIDFETHGIESRPKYPPEPAGFSIKRPGDRKSTYHAFGHPTRNNCTKEQAQRVLRDAYRSGLPLLFQNAKFDLDVAEVHMGCKLPSWDKVHDTLYQLFLYDPHAPSLSLKPAAERILGMKPEERDAVRDWVLANVPEAKRKPTTWGAYIWMAPGDLVGKYADGDVVRTDKLFNKLYPYISDHGMTEAYDRERRIMPHLLQNEREGVVCDVRLLERDILVYTVALESADEWLRKRLKTPNLNMDSDNDFADALERCGIVTAFKMTAKGNRSVSKKNLTLDMFNDAKVAAAYGYRNRLSTCLGTFMNNWLDNAKANNGRVHTSWNQVRQSNGEKNVVGARTGRMSNNSGFMNAPKNWKKAKAEGYVYPSFVKMIRNACDIRAGQPVPDLPRLRTYFLPDDKHSLWGRRDYNQQELRITSHFEDGDLMRHYNEDPRYDLHEAVRQGVLEIAGIELVRDHAKIVNFQDIYGGGATALAEGIGCTMQEAQAIKRAKRALMPDFAALVEGLVLRGKAGLPIRTWGGSEIYCEEPKFVAKFNRVMSFEYKLINYLIQRSAAECTKESIIRYFEHPKRQGRFLITVHDENNISAPKKVFKQEMLLLREVMQSVEFDVPMLSDGEYGPNWGTLEALKER